MPSQVWEKMNADLASLALEAKPLAQKSVTGSLTQDEDQRLGDLATQINNLREQMEEQGRKEDRANSILTLDNHFNQPADNVKRSVSLDTATDPDDKGKAWQKPGTALVNSESYKNALKNGTGVTKYNPTEVGSFWGPDGTKAVIGSATAPASALFAQVLPTMYRGLERPLVMRDVLMNLNTTSDAVTVLQENVFTNAAAETAEATTVSNGAKPESAITFTEATFPVQIIAHWIPVTRQLLEDLAFMETYINERLLTGLARREDAQILNGNGTAPNLRGILATSGIQNLDQTYFTGAPVKSATFDNENLNRIRRGIRVIQVTGQAQPTFIVMNPADAENVDTSVDANRQYIFGGPAAGLPRRLWGLPVVESDNMTAGGVLVGDGTMAAVVDRQAARIYTTDSHSDFFVRNLFVVLAEERIALPVFRPAAFAFVDLI
jgi:HK97 family phage major capsid protein